MKAHTFLIFVIALVLLFVTQSAFIVVQGTQAMVLQFGNPVQKFTDPGLKFKMPFVQNVKVFSQKILSIDPDPEEVMLQDEKRIVVDTLGRYQIVDMLNFNNTMATQEQAEQRLDNIINSTAREVLGTVTLDDLLSTKRDEIMAEIKKRANAAVHDEQGNPKNGVDIVDVRIIRADLPEQTTEAVFKRMISARQYEAAQYRGEGTQAAQQITSEADKESTVILANAEKQAQDLRGEGDAEATKIYADAFRKDPEFYSFYRTMQAYRESLDGDKTTMILSPDGDFFRYFRDEQGKKQ